MNLPPLLQPSSTHTFHLPASSSTVFIPKATPSFHRWSGISLADTYHGKEVLDFGGKPAFAELAILWSLQSAGWDGVWIDTYSKLFRTGYWDTAPVKQLPAGPASVLDRIREAAGSRFGAWDVFCWHDQDYFFAESKRSNRDKIRDTQVRWLEAGLKAGFSPDNFLVVEWELD